MKSIEQKIIIDSKIESDIRNNNYSSAAAYFFRSQLKSWQLLKKNYDALEKAQTKSFRFDGFELKVQFNPERIKSTSAKVDDYSIKNRKCFLCAENLPDEQKGILLPDDYLLLCNPYPILPQHFTLCSTTHKPQRIMHVLNDYLELTRLLSSKYSLVYNGPACGASAPDHLHFQVVTKSFMPIENDIHQLKKNFGKIIRQDKLTTASFIDDGLRRLVFVVSSDKKELIEMFQVIYKIYYELPGNQPEPLMNLICSFDIELGWNIIIFLRSKHRPEVFFKEDPEKLLISPAAIDLGGVIVAPRETDFLRADKEILNQILNEVSLDKKIFSLIVEKVKIELS